MKKITLTRQELYSMVWKEPLSSILKKYQINYLELRNVLHDLDIPIPENGYWSKIKFRKPVEIKPLPEGYSGKNDVEFLEKELNDEKPSG